MKSLNSLIPILLSIATALAAEEKAIQSALLDDRTIYTVPIATNRVTTISFPSAITAMDGAGITLDAKTAGQFQLAHTRGSAFFSLRALAPHAAGNLNVRWNKHTYVFEFIESPSPVLSLIMQARSASPPSEDGAPNLSSTRLLSLLDKARVFPLLKQQHPDAVEGVEFVTYATKPLVSNFDDYEIRLEEAYRFNAEDTLVFRATLTNKTAQPIRYRPGSFALRVGNRLYPQSISDAPGIIPANGESTVYFAVTGTPDGGRNELSLKNSFGVVLERYPTTPDAK